VASALIFYSFDRVEAPVNGLTPSLSLLYATTLSCVTSSNLREYSLTNDTIKAGTPSRLGQFESNGIEG
jgi:hypothetical protein